MKGFRLKTGREQVCGAIETGLTSILVNFKGDKCRLELSSMSSDGNTSYTWYVSDLEAGNVIDICFEEDITDLPAPVETKRFNMLKEDAQKDMLETYHRLKRELIEEGLV